MDEQELLSESVFRSISDGLVVVSQEGNIADLNVPAAYALDVTANDVLGKHFLNNLNSKELENQLADIFAEPDVYSTKRFEIEANGRVFAVSFDPIFSAKHERLGILVVLHDVTDERNLIKAKDEFIWASSHEFYTPLAAIRGNLEFLKTIENKNDLTDQVDDVIESVSDAYEGFLRVLKIAQDTLDIAAVETGRAEFKLRKFDLAKVAKLVADKYSKKIADKGLKLELDIKEAGARGDEAKTQDIVDELVSNAIKFTDKGTITIRVHSNERSIVEVSDTGIGIDISKSDELFLKFGRLNPTLTAHRGGVGLGLYKSKIYAEGMGAELKLKESKPNKGATFALELLG